MSKDKQSFISAMRSVIMSACMDQNGVEAYGV